MCLLRYALKKFSYRNSILDVISIIIYKPLWLSDSWVAHNQSLTLGSYEYFQAGITGNSRCKISLILRLLMPLDMASLH